MNKFYVLITLTIVVGEYEFTEHHTALITIEPDMINVANDYIIMNTVRKYVEGYYQGPFTRDKEKYFFYNGEVCIKNFTWDIITDQEYLFFQRFEI